MTTTKSDNSRTRPAADRSDDASIDWVLGSNPAMRQVAQHLERAAEVECTVLISGETGTGKELCARLLHRRGPRADRPFVPVNCAALTVSLAESQLFGHEKGAFTGAAGSSLGVFRAADSGVVFLDEVGEMPLELQPKLLRVLQHQEVTPVGASHPETVDVQVVAATNRDLEREVAKGTFREDLFYRLNMVELRLPALRERLEDVPVFLAHFCERFAERYGRPRLEPTGEQLRQFCEYSWPGNIRQLAHVVEQAYVLGGEPTVPSRRGGAAQASAVLPYFDLNRLRDEALRQALRATGGHKGQAARLLGVHANTLTRLLGRLEGDDAGADR